MSLWWTLAHFNIHSGPSVKVAIDACWAGLVQFFQPPFQVQASGTGQASAGHSQFRF